MKFERTDEYQRKLSEQALFDDKHIILNATVSIISVHGKLKAYCKESQTYLQFPSNLRSIGKEYIADVVEVIREDNVSKYYRAQKNSIRDPNTNEVLA